MERRSVGIRQSASDACEEPMRTDRRLRRRQPTPYEHAFPPELHVQLELTPTLDTDEATTCNRGRLRRRQPTPYEHILPRELKVQFGLTTLLDADEDFAFAQPLRRQRPRLSSGTYTQPLALGAEALNERNPTPRNSHSDEPEDWCDDERPISVDRHAFEDAFPRRRCSAAEACAVCHESLEGEDAKVFPCGHLYHSECILQWFSRQLTCPLCRRSFVPELGSRVAEPTNTPTSRNAQPTLERSRTL